MVVPRKAMLRRSASGARGSAIGSADLATGWEADGLDETAVGWDAAAGGEDGQVTWDEKGGLDLSLDSAPDDMGDRDGLLPERRQGLLGSPFGGEADDGVEDDDGQDGEGLDPVAEGERNECGRHQEQDDEAPKLGQEDDQGRSALGRFEGVGADRGEAGLGVLVGQAVVQVGAELLGGLVGRLGVPDGDRGVELIPS
jgi:hypothetical protein